MKKLTAIFAAFMLLIGVSAFANTGSDNVSKTVKDAFEKNFSGAVNVTWEQTDELYFASFKLNEREVNAAYNEKGELIGISRKLQLSEVPLNVTKSLKQDFEGYTVLNSVTEMLYEGQTVYYATVEGISKILKLKCFSDGQIYVEKRIKK